MRPIELLNSKLKTRIGIKDFKDKITRSSFFNYGNCALCNKKMSPTHLLIKCKVTELWERKLGFAKQCQKRRKESLIKTKPKHIYKRGAMWITNWSIWKTYNKIRFGEIKEELRKMK